MCRALDRSGLQTVVVTTDADGRGRLAVKVGSVSEYAGLQTVFFPRQLTESFKWSAPLAAWLDAHVAEFDLVHVHAVFSHSSLAAGRACRRAGVPYIVRPLGTLDPSSLKRHAARKQLLLLLGARRLLRGAAAIHYTAREEQRLAELRSPWLPRGIVVPLGVDETLLEGEAAPRVEQAPAIVAMSRLDRKKGIELLIQAFHRAAGNESLRDWRLILAGDGAPRYVAVLERLARDGAGSNRIEFRGWVSGEARHALLASARLFVLPSLQENFGVALVEAMACGVPAVVCPGVNLAAELELAGAGWVSERTTDALAETLQAAMSSRDVLDRKGAHARQFARQFRWAHVAGLLGGMYDDVLHDSAPHAARSLSVARVV
jgi:glycosyltransferase involved in cell wall biosynthesis